MEAVSKLNINSPKENPPIGIISSMINIKNPIDSKERYVRASLSGRSKENTLDPSRGGIGNKLKIARSKLICTIKISTGRIRAKNVIENIEISFINRLKIIAIKMFVSGPAMDTMAKSFLPSFRLNGSTGTGFAAPKITGEPDKIKISGNAMLITGSIWFLGFRVSLPKSLAVGSPSRSATYP